MDFINKRLIEFLSSQETVLKHMLQSDRDNFVQEVDDFRIRLDGLYEFLALQFGQLEFTDLEHVLKRYEQIAESFLTEMSSALSTIQKVRYLSEDEIKSKKYELSVFDSLLQVLQKIEDRSTASPVIPVLRIKMRDLKNRYVELENTPKEEIETAKQGVKISHSEALFNIGYYLLNSLHLKEVPTTAFHYSPHNMIFYEIFFPDFDTVKYEDLLTAKKFFELALKADPGNVLASVYKEIALLMADYLNEYLCADRFQIIENLKNINDRFPDSPLVQLELARAYASMGMYQFSKDLLDKINFEPAISNYICYQSYDIYNQIVLNEEEKADVLWDQIGKFLDIESNLNSATCSPWYSYAAFRYERYLSRQNYSMLVSHGYLLDAIRKLPHSSFINELHILEDSLIRTFGKESFEENFKLSESDAVFIHSNEEDQRKKRLYYTPYKIYEESGYAKPKFELNNLEVFTSITFIDADMSNISFVDESDLVNVVIDEQKKYSVSRKNILFHDLNFDFEEYSRILYEMVPLKITRGKFQVTYVSDGPMMLHLSGLQFDID